MRWTDRQQAMLTAMGLGGWWLDAARLAEARGDASAGDDEAAVATPPAPSHAVAQGRAAAAPVAPAATAAPAASSTHAPAPSPASSSAGSSSPPGRRLASTPTTRTSASAAPAVSTIPIAHAAEAATLDWPQLEAAVQACRACALGATRQQAVFGVGHRQAHWMLVGEAPGEQEDREGEPFVGAAGQLLDRILAALGLTRSEADAARQVYIANTLKCRPPRNRNPEPAEMAQCAPWLARQIALVQPRVIVAMGRFAIQQLLHTDEAVGRLRGRVHEAAGVPVVVTYHPAYLLRQPLDKAKAWEDWCLAGSVIDAGG